jgi:hypothetical protein
MKSIFDATPAALKFGFRREEAAAVVGSVQLFDDMVRAKWLRPVVYRHKLVIFDRGDIQRAWSRILAGEIPPARTRTAKNLSPQNQ